MLAQTPPCSERPPLPLRLEAHLDSADDAAATGSSRSSCAGFGSVVLGIVAISACALVFHTAAQPEKPSSLFAEAAFNPSVVGFQPGSSLARPTALRPAFRPTVYERQPISAPSMIAEAGDASIVSRRDALLKGGLATLGAATALRPLSAEAYSKEGGTDPTLGTASKGMGLLRPFFKAETAAQAAVTNLGSYDAGKIRAEIAEIANRAPVVILTYTLSPFSKEAIAVLESTGCKFENVVLGQEWFLLGPHGSALRAELGNMYGQTSLPHVWIGGEWMGGLYSGAGDKPGLAELANSGVLEEILKREKAL